MSENLFFLVIQRKTIEKVKKHFFINHHDNEMMVNYINF